MRTTLVLAGSLAVVALAAFDLTAASRIRCVSADDRHRVVTLADLDDLGPPVAFTIDGPLRRRVAASDTIVVSGRATVASDRTGPATAVLGRLDDGRDVPAAYDAGNFTLSLAPHELAPGTHHIAFVVVAGDLSGFFAAPAALTLDVN